METLRIEDFVAGPEIETLRLRGMGCRCVYYKEEICSAPKIRFEVCRTCHRMNPRAALRGLFEKIKLLAIKLFNLQATEPGQPLLG